MVHELEACHVGVVFALGIEAGCFEDRLQGVVTVRAGGLVFREGGLHGRRVVVVRSGAGSENAARAAERLIDGHRPRHVIAAGLAGGLAPELNRTDILVANRLVNEPTGAEIMLSEDSPSLVCRGTLLTADRVVHLPEEKRALFERYGALAIDMETYGVAEVCRRQQVAFSAIRVIGDAADERLPEDVERLLRQRTATARLGAAVGILWRHPARWKELYRLRENSLAASGRLAQFLADSLSG